MVTIQNFIQYVELFWTFRHLDILNLILYENFLWSDIQEVILAHIRELPEVRILAQAHIEEVPEVRRLSQSQANIREVPGKYLLDLPEADF